MEEAFDRLLDASGNAPKYSRSLDRSDMRAGRCARKIHTTAGEVELKVSKLQKTSFVTAIIERYRRR